MTDQRTPFASTAARNRLASSSCPASPESVAFTPRAARLTATLAAPPGRSSTSSILTIGTGASGLTRVVAPRQNRSSMTSPMTNILASVKDGILDIDCNSFAAVWGIPVGVDTCDCLECQHHLICSNIRHTFKATLARGPPSTRGATESMIDNTNSGASSL